MANMSSPADVTACPTQSARDEENPKADAPQQQHEHGAGLTPDTLTQDAQIKHNDEEKEHYDTTQNTPQDPSLTHNTESEQDDKELEVQAVDQHTSQDPSLAHSAENEQNDEGNEHHNITQHTPRASSVTQDDGSDKHEGGEESLGIGSQSAVAIKSQSQTQDTQTTQPIVETSTDDSGGRQTLATVSKTEVVKKQPTADQIRDFNQKKQENIDRATALSNKARERLDLSRTPLPPVAPAFRSTRKGMPHKLSGPLPTAENDTAVEPEIQSEDVDPPEYANISSKGKKAHSTPNRRVKVEDTSEADEPRDSHSDVPEYANPSEEDGEYLKAERKFRESLPEAPDPAPKRKRQTATGNNMQSQLPATASPIMTWDLPEGNNIVEDGARVTLRIVDFPQLGSGQTHEKGKPAENTKPFGGKKNFLPNKKTNYDSRGIVELLKFCYTKKDVNLRKSQLADYKNFSTKRDVIGNAPSGKPAYVEVDGRKYYLCYAGKIALWGSKVTTHNYKRDWTTQNEVRSRYLSPLMLVGNVKVPYLGAGKAMTDIPKELFDVFDISAAKSAVLKTNKNAEGPRRDKSTAVTHAGDAEEDEDDEDDGAKSQVQPPGRKSTTAKTAKTAQTTRTRKTTKTAKDATGTPKGVMASFLDEEFLGFCSDEPTGEMRTQTGDTEEDADEGAPPPKKQKRAASEKESTTDTQKYNRHGDPMR